MIYQRKLFPKLKKQINTEEIIVLTGMRRTGKTTLYRQLFEEIESENKLFLDIENPLEQQAFEEIDYNNIIKNLETQGINPEKKLYLFLDEIQAMPKIVKPIKYLYDHYNIKFFLTGSSSFYLKNLFPESLAGRKFIFELYPLDFEEFLVFKEQPKKFHDSFEEKAANKNSIAYEKTIKLYEEFLQYGGFPGVVVAETQENKQRRLEDIFKSYYEKDIRGLADFRDLNAVRDLILLLAQRVGSRADITKISKEIGVTRSTLYSYLGFLEATYFLSTVPPYSKNVDREISGRVKIFLCDTGILNVLAKVNKGQILENAIFNKLKHNNKVNYYQRRESEKEIDFIINQKTALEVKNKATEAYMKQVESLSESLGLKNHFIVSKDFVELDKVIPVTEL